MANITSKKKFRKSRNVETKVRKSRKSENRGRPVGLTAEKSALRGEKMIAAYEKSGSYQKVADKFGVSYACVYQRVNYGA